MKNVLALTMIAAMSAATLGAPAFAQNAAPAVMAQDSMVNIVLIKANSESSMAQTPVPEQYLNASEEMMMKAQAEVKADPALMAELEKQSVQMNNIVGVETAANGGKTVYVK